MKKNYDDIIALPHHSSTNRRHMSMYERAAQFSPFAALKGYEEEINEAARFTESKTELDVWRIEELNEKLLLLAEQATSHPLIKLTYFVPDAKKSGGKYLTVEDALAKIDCDNRRLVLKSGLTVSFNDIFELDLT